LSPISNFGSGLRQQMMMQLLLDAAMSKVRANIAAMAA
jgi:hypothetical protein